MNANICNIVHNRTLHPGCCSFREPRQGGPPVSARTHRPLNCLGQTQKLFASAYIPMPSSSIGCLRVRLRAPLVCVSRKQQQSSLTCSLFATEIKLLMAPLPRLLNAAADLGRGKLGGGGTERTSRVHTREGRQAQLFFV